MLITVEGVLGVTHAEIPLEPGKVTEVVGPNASGKSSVAVAAQGVLTHHKNPLGLPATLMRWYGREGHPSDPQVTCGDVSWWPVSAKLAAPAAETPRSTAAAAGLVDFTLRTSPKERAKAFQSVLLPPLEELLATAAEELAKFLPADDVAGVIQMVEERGWDEAHNLYAKRAREAKGGWSQVTGAHHGMRVAADWTPDGWQAGYDHMSVIDAEAQVNMAREALMLLHQEQGVTQAVRDMAEQALAELPKARQAFTDAKAGWDTAKEDAEKHQRESAPIRQADDEISRRVYDAQVALKALSNTQAKMHCPACETALTLGGPSPGPRVLSVWDEEAHEQAVTDAEAALTDAEEAAAVSLAGVRQMRDRDQELRAEMEAAGYQLRAAKSKVADLEQAAKDADTAVVETDQAVLAEAQQQVEDAKDVVRMIRAEKKATQLQETIVRYTAAAKELGPDGVRARMIDDGMHVLNSGLAKIAYLTGWLPVEVDDSNVLWGGLPVWACSESEKWRAQASIQLALAAISRSDAVVLDRGDVLDAENREALHKVLAIVAESAGFAVLLCSTGEPVEDAQGIQVAILEGATL